MNSKEHWENYKEYTHDLTANCRKLAFAAAAICWIFKTIDYQFPRLIVWALGLLVGFFICDILQYLIAAIMLKNWIEKQEDINWKKNGSLGGKYDKPKSLDTPAYWLWQFKIGFLLASYCCIGIHIIII